ncbi:MAG: hypothetical protein ACLQE9_16650 [Roseiarcus sp.]
MRQLFVEALASVFLFAAGSAGAACFDLSKSEPHSLTGLLSQRIFPGPPGFTDVRRGDTPEPGYLLQLPEAICLTGDEFADPAKVFSEVQLVETDKTASAMRALADHNVTVELTQPIPAMTGHHHRPLVAWVTDIVAVADKAAEYGTAATAVRGFYYALAGGNGEQAAVFIVPERRKGAFSPDEMTRFYGGLVAPLELLSLAPSGPGAYLVRYQFASRARACNGRAIVKTVNRGGSNLIASIQALDGC